MAKKLFLVLDLDHTLLDTVLCEHVLLHDKEALSLLHEDASSSSALHHSPELGIFTKLRPYVHEFLREASSMFELYVYTMGSGPYAEAMVRLLDPTQALFRNRIVSRNESKCLKVKSLDLIAAPLSATVILDDLYRVWSDFLPNLIHLEQYSFFSSDSEQSAPSLLSSSKDESAENGTLASTLDLLRKVHHAFFDDEVDAQIKTHAAEKDVRLILRWLRRNILTGCKIAFCSEASRHPSHEPEPELFRRLAKQLGAACSTAPDDSVTHVVASAATSDTAKWALTHDCYLVHPRWIMAAYFTWKRNAESKFTVDVNPIPCTFSETTNLHIQQQSYVVGKNPPAWVEILHLCVVLMWGFWCCRSVA